jgi:hypothetical protein
LHAFERFRHRAPQHAFGGAVTGQRPADEVVMRGIAHVLGDAGLDIAQIDEARRQGVARGRRRC